MGKAQEAEYLEMFKEYYAEQAKYISDVRKIKHDMQAHLIMLQHYLMRDEYEAAKRYLREITEYQPLDMQPPIDLGNNFVNAIVFATMNRSQNPILLEYNGELPEGIGIADYDLCILFSNLFSNCVEACEKLERTERMIELEIKQMESNLSIIVENPIEWAVDEKELGHGTSKDDKDFHGYGIGNIKSIVEKYRGSISFTTSKDRFRVKIKFSDIVKENLIC